MINICNWCGRPLDLSALVRRFCFLCGHEIGSSRITCRCVGCILNRQILRGKEESLEKLIKDLMK
jgi:hypothetical protein